MNNSQKGAQQILDEGEKKSEWILSGSEPELATCITCITRREEREREDLGREKKSLGSYRVYPVSTMCIHSARGGWTDHTSCWSAKNTSRRK